MTVGGSNRAGYAPEQKPQLNMLLHALMMQLRREQAVTKILHIRKARIPILKVGHTAPHVCCSCPHEWAQRSRDANSLPAVSFWHAFPAAHRALFLHCFPKAVAWRAVHDGEWC